MNDHYYSAFLIYPLLLIIECALDGSYCFAKSIFFCDSDSLFHEISAQIMDPISRMCKKTFSDTPTEKPNASKKMLYSSYITNKSYKRVIDWEALAKEKSIKSTQCMKQ